MARTLKDTILPLSEPLTGVNGKAITSIPIPKGTTVYIAVGAANHNRRIWGDDALEFKPERWANGKAGARTEKVSGIYGNTMTFIGGERSCMCALIPVLIFFFAYKTLAQWIPIRYTRD
jgi:hypothetical protein